MEKRLRVPKAILSYKANMGCLDYSQKRVGGNLELKSHQTAGLWCKTTLMEEIAE
jgi:hypothetical protein